MVEAVAWLAGVLALLLVPTGLLLFRNFRSRWTIIVLVFFLANAIYAAWYLAPWEFWSFWMRRVLVVLALVAIAVGLWKLKGTDWKRPGWAALIASVIVFLAGLYFASLNIQSIGASSTSEAPIALQSPLKNGTFAVVQGGAGPPLQVGHAGTPSQLYALDIVKLDSALLNYQNYLDASDYQNTTIWGEPVYAPCTGVVEWKRDGLDDGMDYDEADGTPAGNVIGLNCDGVSIMMAHFLKDSITVELDERVEVGEMIGRIGNSGRATGPHLHIHAERGPLKKDVSDNPGVPMLIDGEFLLRGRLYEFGE